MFGQMGPTYIKGLPLAVAVPHISSSYHSLLLTLALARYALSYVPLCSRVLLFIACRCLLVLTHLLTRSALGDVASRDYKTMASGVSLSGAWRSYKDSINDSGLLWYALFHMSLGLPLFCFVAGYCPLYWPTS